MARKKKLPTPKRFTPKNPWKYKGNVDRIIFRSAPERSLMRFFDQNGHVLKWESEPFPIQYQDPTTGKKRRYFPDFFVQMDDGTVLLIEYKPESQALPPVPSKRRTGAAMQRYQAAFETYAINQAKWAAAIEFSKNRGARFSVWTERHLRACGIG